MTNFAANTTKLQVQLTQIYFELPPFAQKIVQLFSVIYAPIDKNSFLSCLSETGALDENNKPFVTKTLSRQIDRLKAAGLLVQENRQNPECHPLLTEVATRHAVETGQFEILVAAVESKLPIRSHWQNECRMFQNLRQCIREIRIGIYRQDPSFINKQIEDYQKYSYSEEKLAIANIAEQICNNPFDADWFQTLPQELYESSISSILLSSALKLSASEDALTLLSEECSTDGKHCSDYLHLILTEQMLLRGCTQEAQQSLERISAQYQNNAAIFWGWLSFLRGENEQAIIYYTDALKVLKKATGKRQIYFNTMGGLFFILALLKDGSVQHLRLAEEYATIIARQSDHWLTFIYARLKMVLQVQQGNLSQKELVVSAHISAVEEENSLQTLLCSLCLYWMDADSGKKRLPNLLEPLYQRALASGHHWLAMETAELLSRLKPSSNYHQQAVTLREDSGIQTIVDLIQPQEAWEMCLNALANLQKEPQTPGKPESELRLAWFITFSPFRCVVQPREQKVNAKGEWSKGRPIAIKRLNSGLSEFDYITPQDMRVCSCIETYGDGTYYGKVEYMFNEKAISALIGHPLVFWEDTPNVRVEIVKGEPELLVKKEKLGRLTLEFSPKLPESQNILNIKETPTRIKVIEITTEHRRIAEIIGKDNKLNVPAIAEKQVLAAINAVSGIVTVHSDIGGGSEGAEEVPAQTLPHIHLLPANTGLKVTILSRPFAQGGPYYRPGAGGETVIAEIEGKRLQTRRNLPEEKQLAKDAVAACPTLTRTEERDGEWVIEDPEECLELLLELQALGSSVVMAWPEGEKLRVSHQADLKDFKLSIQRQQDWFAATGELKLNQRPSVGYAATPRTIGENPQPFYSPR